MIRYFTNYSYGGYEELYLGSYEDQEEYRYHLPLLANKKAKLADDPTNKKLSDEVERLSQYVLIQKNGKTTEGTLPEGAFTIISNPGYKTICRRLGSQFVVAVSDVASEDHDEMGGGKRENPFTMLFVFDEENTSLMDALLYQLLEKETDWRALISSLFVYDPIANGLRFSLGELNQAIKTLETVHVSGVNHKADVPMIVLEKNYELAYTMEIQKLKGKSLGAAYNAEGTLLKGAGLVAHSETTPVPDTDEGENAKQKTDPDQKPLSPVDINAFRKQIETELRPIISKEEREKVTHELRQKYLKEMEQKEMEFIAERKRLIYINIGAIVGVVAILFLLFLRTCSGNQKDNSANVQVKSVCDTLTYKK